MRALLAGLGEEPAPAAVVARLERVLRGRPPPAPARAPAARRPADGAPVARSPLAVAAIAPPSLVVVGSRSTTSAAASAQRGRRERAPRRRRGGAVGRAAAARRPRRGRPPPRGSAASAGAPRDAPRPADGAPPRRPAAAGAPQAAETVPRDGRRDAGRRLRAVRRRSDAYRETRPAPSLGPRRSHRDRARSPRCPVLLATPTPYDWERCGSCGAQRLVAADGAHAGFAALAAPWRRVVAALLDLGAVRLACRGARAAGAAATGSPTRRRDRRRRGLVGRRRSSRRSIYPTGRDRRARPHARQAPARASTSSATTGARRSLPARRRARGRRQGAAARVARSRGRRSIAILVAAQPATAPSDDAGTYVRRSCARSGARRSPASRPACCSPAAAGRALHDAHGAAPPASAGPSASVEQRDSGSGRPAAPAAPASDVPAA